MFCAHCGNLVKDAAKFCTACGTRQVEALAQTVPVMPKPTVILLNNENDDTIRQADVGLKYIDVIEYFINNFRSINSFEDIINHYQNKIADICETNELGTSNIMTRILTRIFNKTYKNERRRVFFIKECQHLFILIDVSFVNNDFANVRLQYLSKGQAEKRYFQNEHKKIKNTLNGLYGPSNNLGIAGVFWYLDNGNIGLSLRKYSFSISVAITDKRYLM